MKNILFKRGIQTKIITAFFLVGGIPVVTGLLLAYMNGTSRLRESIGENFKGLALEVSRKADLIIEKEIVGLKNLAGTSEIRAAVEDSNRIFRALSDTGLLHSLEQGDINWKNPLDPSFREKLIDNHASLNLKSYMETRSETYPSFFITNEKGVLVGSINAHANFYSAHEKWWERVYREPQGRPFIGDLFFDEVVGQFLINFSVPIRDREGEKTIGVLAVFYEVRRLLSPVVSVVRFGKTGHAMMVDSTGRVVMCPVMPIGSFLQDPQLVKNITGFAPEWALVPDDGHGGSDSIVGFAPLVGTTRLTLDSNGKSWHSFVRQAPSELYAPLDSLLSSVMISGGLLIGLVGFLGVVISRRFTRPIKDLQEGAEEIGRGNLNVEVNIKTNDEIEMLANEFNHMSQKLRESYFNLEQKVADRTKELAALNLIAMTINQSLDLKVILDSALKKVLEVLALEAGAIWLWDEEMKNLKLHLFHGFSSNWVRTFQVISSDDMTEEHFLNTNKSVLRMGTGALHREGRVSIGEEVSAFLSVPLQAKGKGLGFLLVASIGPRSFSPQERELLEGMGGELSVAIENGLLYARTKEMVKKLEEIDQFKSDFFSNVSHELRTPLTSIIGHSELLMQQFGNKITDEEKESIENIQFSGGHLLEIVNNLLDLSRIKAQKMGLHYGEFSVRNLVSNCTKTVQALVLKKGLTLKTSFEEEDLILHADEIKIRQILLNLLSNAIKFTPRAGEILVEAKTSKRNGQATVEISVSDTGEGIGEQDLEKIFEEFQQIDSSLTRKYGGSGLGLPIARQFAEMHGGSIRVESRLGEGTCFTVSLPQEGVDSEPVKT